MACVGTGNRHCISIACMCEKASPAAELNAKLQRSTRVYQVKYGRAVTQSLAESRLEHERDSLPKRKGIFARHGQGALWDRDKLKFDELMQDCIGASKIVNGRGSAVANPRHVSLRPGQKLLGDGRTDQTKKEALEQNASQGACALARHAEENVCNGLTITSRRTSHG